jgi:hypothetical protein
MCNTDDRIHRNDVHDTLHPFVAKLQLLSRLAPLLDSDAEYHETMMLVHDMQGDYIHQLRRALDGLCGGEGA